MLEFPGFGKGIVFNRVPEKGKSAVSKTDTYDVAVLGGGAGMTFAMVSGYLTGEMVAQTVKQSFLACKTPPEL